jgi:hypothetical protein
MYLAIEMTKFDRLKIKLKTGWGLDLFRGQPGNHYGWRSGFIVVGNHYEKRFRSLKEVDNAWRIERLLKPEID